MKGLKSHIVRVITALMLLAAIPSATEATVPAQKTTTRKNNSISQKASGKKASGKGASKANSAKTSAKKSNAKGGASSKQGAKKATGKKKTPETSAELKRKQEATQKEITLTRKQIEENDAAVRKNLSELNRLGADIDAGKKKVAEASARVSTLQKRIETLSGQISENEKSLERLRAEYLKAIKKMRTKRKTNSTLAFIFSSSDFNQALRRMRYLKQFGAWKDRQAAEISSRVATLKTQTAQLESSKTAQSKALAVQVKTQEELNGQFARQNAIVADLKKNGEALNAHLANKQAEANALKGRVAALIAEEERKARLAEEERQARLAREEEARRQREAEEARRAKAEEERLAALEKEKNSGNKAESSGDLAKEDVTPLVADASSHKKDKKQHVTSEKKSETTANARKRKNNSKDTKQTKKETKNEKPKTEQPQKGSSTQYADARKRKPRTPGAASGEASSASTSVSKTASASSSATAGKSFESMRGQLPRPVSGHFRITGRFGRHSLPDLPDVVYDNPGIDAETAAGASAQAVFAGKVSGVYMIPGFSTVVIVNHGNYYTVYGNIASASVKVGDVVKQGQALGRVDTSEDNPSYGAIHFEVWKNREKLDPASWIR